MTFSRFIRICVQRLRSLFRKERLDDELDQELAFHLTQLEKENLDAGMSAADARREARKALGNMAVFKEECRDERRVSWLYDFFQDARYGVRMMRKHPGFTAIAAISLALGIGGNTAILNVGKAALLGDLSFPDARRLVAIQAVPEVTPAQIGPASVPDFVAWMQRNTTFEAIGASVANQEDFTRDESGAAAERLVGQAVTPSLFNVLKVEPELGRVFNDDEAPVGSPKPVIILSHHLWERRFGADSAIIGKRIRMDGRDLEIIGVMPQGFWYPNLNSEFWIPFSPTRYQLESSGRLFNVAGRMKKGITVEQARADVAGISAQLARDFPDRHRGWSATVVPLHELWFGWIREPLMALEAAVILVLLIACANVSTLLLARVPARQSEITMRVLLGAGRGRIIRQFLTESLLLSLVAGALGVLIAWWGVRSLESVQPPIGRIPISGLGVSSGILLDAILLSIVSSLLFGFLPALVAFSSEIDAQQATAHRRRGRLADILVSAQVGLALVLLVSSGLLLNSFVRLVLDDRGFDPKDILTFEYRIPVQDYMDSLGRYRGMPSFSFAPPTLQLQRVHEKLKALPGAESVAGSSARPVNGVIPPMAGVFVEGRSVQSSGQPDGRVVYFLVTENFFETMKTPLLSGRDFNQADTRSTPWVALINETMAHRFWPDENPIGKHFTIDAASGEQPREVIGIVRDIALQYIRTGPPQPVAYTLYLQEPETYNGFNANMYGQMTFFVRSHQDPLRLASAARREVAQIDPRRPIANVQTMSDFVGEGMRTRRYYAAAFGVFAIMATILAAVAVYGVMSSSVSQRTREIGIHMAMGAKARDIIRLIGARALVLVSLGLLSGFFSSLALTHLLDEQLWGITPTDPPTFALVITLLIAVASAACFFPARRAMRVDPTEALRMD